MCTPVPYRAHRGTVAKGWAGSREEKRVLPGWLENVAFYSLGSHPDNVDFPYVVLWGSSCLDLFCRLPGQFVTKSGCVTNSNNEGIQEVRTLSSGI